jgi:glycosyltransferase involved in cell wall biosynthesis
MTARLRGDESRTPVVSVVVMAFNEADNVRPTVAELVSTLDTLCGDYEIIIVNDGSHDGTGEIANAISEEHSCIRVIHHETNRGLGGVYRTGFSSARGTYLTFFPADGQFPAEILQDFLPRAANTDLVLGYLAARTDSLVGKGLSALERALYAALFGRLPKFQGVFMARRDLLASLPLRSSGRGWAILMEFIIRATRDKWRIESVPTSVRPRASGQSKVNNVRTIVSNFMQMVALRRLL